MNQYKYDEKNNTRFNNIYNYSFDIGFEEIEFNKLKYNIIGQKTRNDAINILNKYKTSQHTYNLSMSYINGKKYDFAFDNDTMIKYMNELNILRYREDVYEEINHLLKNTSDIAQIKTFIRIANTKQMRPQFITMKSLKQRNIEHVITKKCPHCGHGCTASRDTKYMICGYFDSGLGYDWEGCGNDWCFTCGKMLCKSWNTDELFLLINRTHDSKCCKKFAKKNNLIYTTNFCLCNNIYVET